MSNTHIPNPVPPTTREWPFRLTVFRTDSETVHLLFRTRSEAREAEQAIRMAYNDALTGIHTS